MAGTPAEDREARRKAQRWTETRRRNHVWSLRLDDEENATLEALYAAYGGSVESRVYGESRGGFLRYLCLAKDARPVRKLMRLPSAHPSARELTVLKNAVVTVGSNVNQIARALNRGRTVHREELEAMMEALHRTVRRIDAVLHPEAAEGHDRDEGTADDRQGPE